MPSSLTSAWPLVGWSAMTGVRVSPLGSESFWRTSTTTGVLVSVVAVSSSATRCGVGHGDGYGGQVAGQVAVAGAVGEGVGALEAVGGGVGDGAVVVDLGLAVGRLVGDDGGQGVAVGVGVAVEDVDDHGCVGVGAGGVVVGTRGGVGDRDGHGGGVGGDAVGDGVVEAVGALERRLGGVDEPVSPLDDGAAARSGLIESGDADRVAVGVGVVL